MKSIQYPLDSFRILADSPEILRLVFLFSSPLLSSSSSFFFFFPSSSSFFSFLFSIWRGFGCCSCCCWCWRQFPSLVGFWRTHTRSHPMEPVWYRWHLPRFFGMLHNPTWWIWLFWIGGGGGGGGGGGAGSPTGECLFVASCQSPVGIGCRSGFFGIARISAWLHPSNWLQFISLFWTASDISCSFSFSFSFSSSSCFQLSFLSPETKRKRRERAGK